MFTKDQLVIKIIRGPRVSTATLERVSEADLLCAYLGDASEPDDVNAFNVGSGLARVNYIPGFVSYIVALDDGEEERMPDLLNAPDKDRIDWLESQARKSPTGISFDWIPSAEGEPSGFRFMRKHHIGEPLKSLRGAIDREMQRS